MRALQARTAHHEKDGIRFCLACHSSDELQPSAGAEASCQTRTGDANTGSIEANIEKILQPSADYEKSKRTLKNIALAGCAEFLQLRPGQVSELEQLLQARQAASCAAISNGAGLDPTAGSLLNFGGNPAQVGLLVIQITRCSSRWGRHSRFSNTAFVAILDAEQVQKLQAVRIARRCNRFFRRFSDLLF